MVKLDVLKGIERELEGVEKELNDICKRFELDIFAEICQYMVNAGGKRIRPALVILAAKAVNSDGIDERIIRVAARMELIHTATLLHDDIVDKAKWRRGKPTVNSLWGDGFSLLSGDYLFSVALAGLVDEDDSGLLKIASEALQQVCEGEIAQQVHTGDISEEHYLEIAKKKTASFFAACCEMGGWLAGGTGGERAALISYGLNLGIAFQVTDDLLDLVGSKEQLGKSVGTDVGEGKLTLPLLYTLRMANTVDDKELKGLLNQEMMDPQKILALVEKYNGLNYTLDMARKYVEEAKYHLRALKESAARNDLAAMADYVVRRNC